MAEEEGEVSGVHGENGELIGVHGEEEGEVMDIHSEEEWKEHMKKGKESKKLIVVDFTATWCGPCRWIAPFFEEIAKKTPNVTFLKVDVDELNSVADEWGIKALLTFIFIKQGKLVDKAGASKIELPQKIAKHAIDEPEVNARGPTKRTVNKPKYLNDYV